jgi:hypothetical protein
MAGEHCITRASTILIIPKSYYVYQIRMDEIGGPCGTLGEEENRYRFLVRDHEGKTTCKT